MSKPTTIMPMPIGQKLEYAHCKKDGGIMGGARPNFLLLPNGWVFAIGRAKDQVLIMFCCSEKCGADWQIENVNRGDRTLQ